jgi:hypothetical protein
MRIACASHSRISIMYHTHRRDEWMLRKPVGLPAWYEDISDFVTEQRPRAQLGDGARLMTRREEVYPISDPEIAARIGVSDN